MAMQRPIEPLISLRIRDQERTFQPGEELEYEFQIDAIQAAEIQTVEASVLWYTEGKGEEDLGVHHFERRVAADAPGGDLRPLRRIQLRLPNSPLSYDGPLVKIRWCVRVRVFLRRGGEVFFEQPFRVGEVQPTRAVSSTQAGTKKLVG